MWSQIILVCISVSIMKSWTLPPANFLSNFATEHDRTSIIIYLPDQKIPHKWIKNYFSGGSDKNVDTIPVSFVIPSLVENFSQILMTNEDLHIFLPDNKDKKSLEISIEFFLDIYSLRGNSRKEHWLLDISYWDGSQEAANDLEDLPTDLDDDLYWYTYLDQETTLLNLTNDNQLNIEIFEAYKINENMKMTKNYYGNWSEEDGINFVNDKKWSRRKNLQVCMCRLIEFSSF